MAETFPDAKLPEQGETRGRRRRRRSMRSPNLTRQQLVLNQAAEEGLLGGQKDSRITGRVPSKLIEAAKARTSFASDTELVTYALAKVALEDDFGEVLLSLKGTVSPALDLEF